MFKFNLPGMAIALVIPLAISLQANAKNKSHVSYDYAPVVSATAIIKIEKHSTPYKDCWTEQVQINQPYEQNRYDNSYGNALFGDQSYTGTILGGLIGGGIGNALGHRKSNKKAGAVVGGLLGGALGYDLTHNRKRAPKHHSPRYENRQHYESQQRCETRYETYEEERIVGYKVRYRYNGHVYSTRTKHDPGNTLRLRIVATPAEN